MQVNGHEYVVMLRSLVWLQNGRPCLREDVLGGLTEATAKLYVQLVEGRSEAAAAQALLALGAPVPLHKDLKAVVRVCQSYAVVAVGPRARSLWRQDAEREAGQHSGSAACCCRTSCVE